MPPVEVQTLGPCIRLPFIHQILGGKKKRPLGHTYKCFAGQCPHLTFSRVPVSSSAQVAQLAQTKCQLLQLKKTSRSAPLYKCSRAIFCDTGHTAAKGEKTALCSEDKSAYACFTKKLISSSPNDRNWVLMQHITCSKRQSIEGSKLAQKSPITPHVTSLPM